MQIKNIDKLVDEYKRLAREAKELQDMRFYTNKTTNTDAVTLAGYIEHPQQGTLARFRYHEIDKAIFREFIDKSLAKKHKRMEEIEKLFANVKE